MYNDEYRFRRRKPDSQWIWWMVGSAVLTGALAIGWRAYLLHQYQVTMENIAKDTTARSQRLMEQSRQQQAEQAGQREERARQEQQRIAAIHQAAEEARAREVRKEAAWRAFFKPTKKCQDDPVTTECANAHIRAKTRFEEAYRDPA